MTAGWLLDRPRSVRRLGSAPWLGYLIGPVFLLVAAWLYWAPPAVLPPAGEITVVDPAQLTTEARRKSLGDPPMLRLGGYDRTCMDCHRLFPARDEVPARLQQHRHVVLDHGINDRCRSCHYVKDRNRLVSYGGEVIGYDQVVELCAKCHGPTYRDWQGGLHGRTNGYWDSTRGEVRRLGCTECHDPHRPRVPAMDPLEPLPGPHTLRMSPLGHPDSRAHEDEDLPESGGNGADGDDGNEKERPR